MSILGYMLSAAVAIGFGSAVFVPALVLTIEWIDECKQDRNWRRRKRRPL